MRKEVMSNLLPSRRMVVIEKIKLIQQLPVSKEQKQIIAQASLINFIDEINSKNGRRVSHFVLLEELQGLEFFIIRMKVANGNVEHFEFSFNKMIFFIDMGFGMTSIE